ncbi:MAG: DUF6036 family nucleotidyltransferase [Actinomycetota bacterium]
MKRSQLAHILRAACVITDDPDMLVIGSQAILASYDVDSLPPTATLSIEADLAFFDDADEKKSDKIDGPIGEESLFHESNGYYGQGVSISTTVLPAGWKERLVPFRDDEAGDSRAVCLDPYDLVVSKLVAGREKDFDFSMELIKAGLIDVAVLSARTDLLPGPQAVKQRVQRWISAAAARL